MKRKNTARNALFTSIISLLLCVSMLVGTTFAWFTDSVVSGQNVIAAGNLDVELYHSDKNESGKVTAETKLFNDITLWEPGVVVYENFKVENAGNLALKYQLSINFANATDNGNGGTLADVLKVAVVEGGFNGDRAAAHGLTYNADLASFALSGELEKGQGSETYGIVIYWEPSDNDNAYNMNNGKTEVLSIDLGVNLFATQEMYEEDSFDATYDKDTEVFTVAEANAMLAENKAVTLVNCIDRQGVITVPAGYTGKLILKDSTIASVQAEAAANITVLGNVTVDASALENTSAITGTELTITGNGNLTAIANGDHAYGIGGDQTTAITIEGVRIVDVKGGHVQPNFINDTSYGKSEPEGGAAIGSGTSGAVITLNNVTIDNAQGGSKAAGIGARFWTGVTVNINNSTINNVEGGNASAGIGGSRLSNGAGAAENVTVNIVNSTVNAVGGEFAAGIGGGYDTYCQAPGPIITINIDENSNITAQGGKYGAGIGTGYHMAGLAGEINCEVNATAGASRDKYTIAQAVGFGVVDNTREAKDNNCSITYMGTVIGIPSEPVRDTAALIAALSNGESVVLGQDMAVEANQTAPYNNKYGIAMNGGVLDGNGNKLDIECYGDDYGIMTTGGTIKNLTIEEGCRAVMIMYPTEDIILDNVNIGGNGVLYPINTGEKGSEGVDLIVTNSTLNGWTSYGPVVESASFTNVSFGQGTYYNNIYGRVLKPYVNTTLTDCTFIEHMNLDLSSLTEGHKVTMTNCFVNGQPVTAAVFTVVTADEQYDTELFTVDLPDWANSVTDCVIFK